jgi:cell wall-associated NlpC family hydrolase
VIGLPPVRSPASSNATSPLAVLGFTGAEAGPALAGFVAAPFLPPLTGGSLGEQAVALAERFLGVPYVWGGASPATGFDCSGLVMYVYGRLGVSLTHYSGAQFHEGTPVPPGDLQPGDLVFFFNSSRGPQHVGMYIGGGRFIQAPHSGDVVKISSLSDAHYALAYVGAVRPYVR